MEGSLGVVLVTVEEMDAMGINHFAASTNDMAASENW